MQRPIYMDNHATTALDSRVLEAMLPYLQDAFGNAASQDHRYGWEAQAACDVAREQVAGLIGAEPEEIVFTSGATESINLALRGAHEAYAQRGNHCVSVETEHRAVLDTCQSLLARGAELTLLSVDPLGHLDLGEVEAALGPSTVFLSVTGANNEIGTLHPLASLGAICASREVLFHVDAAQLVGKLPVSVSDTEIHLMSVSAHKLHGPKGVGALYVRRRRPRVRLVPQIDGGGHERGRRSGTLNVPGIVGMGKACELAGQEMADEARRLAALRDRLLAGLLAALPGLRVNGDLSERLPGNLNVSLPQVDAAKFFSELREVAVSAGAACTSAHPGPSHVLTALGVEPNLPEATVRFGLGRFNTTAEVDVAVGAVVAAAQRAALDAAS